MLKLSSASGAQRDQGRDGKTHWREQAISVKKKKTLYVYIFNGNSILADRVEYKDKNGRRYTFTRMKQIVCSKTINNIIEIVTFCIT